MKIKTSMKVITENYKKVFRCGYCDLQLIMRNDEPTFYNSGVYGWNCDIYTDNKRNIAITTGYRNMRGERIPDELIKKYNDIAKAAIEQNGFGGGLDFTLETNKELFLQELDSLEY